MNEQFTIFVCVNTHFHLGQIENYTHNTHLFAIFQTDEGLLVKTHSRIEHTDAYVHKYQATANELIIIEYGNSLNQLLYIWLAAKYRNASMKIGVGMVNRKSSSGQ